MSRRVLSFAGVIALAGIAASLAIQHSGQVKLREKATASQRQAGELAQLAAENERLSNLVARAAGPETLSPDQLRELLRLRGQIGLLRQATNEAAQLEAANEHLRAAPAELEKQLAEARAAPNFWPKEQLAFAGYADPESTLKTMLWAMNNGDARAYLACWGSGPDVNVAFGDLRKDETEAQIAAAGKMLSQSLVPAAGFHIVNRSAKSPDRVVLNLSFDGEGRTRKFVAKRTGSEWKLENMLYPGETEP